MDRERTMTVILRGGMKLYLFYTEMLYQRLLNAGEAKVMGRDSTMTLDLFPEYGNVVTLEFPVELLESVSITKVETVTFTKGMKNEQA